jgi:hypothetical protein
MKPSHDDPDELAAEQPFPGLSALKQVTPPPSLVPAVMQRIAEPPPPSLWRWLMRPRRLELRVSPLGALVFSGATMGLVLVLALGRSAAPPATPHAAVAARAAAAAPGGEVVLVRFVIAAKGARRVQVAGDFNAWNPEDTVLVDADGQGTFVATVPLKRGAYEYMFLVDGRWMTDPAAIETRPDGFGRANAVLRL